MALLRGMAAAIEFEADHSTHEHAAEVLVYLLADVLEAIDRLDDRLPRFSS